MKGKKLLIYTSIAILTILLSLVLFYLGISNTPKTAMNNSCFAFVIVAEIVFYTMIYIATDKKFGTFTKTGVSVMSTLYILISLILNTVLQWIFGGNIRACITINISLIIIFSIMILVVFLASGKQEEKE